MTTSMRGRLATAVQILAALALIIGSFAWLEGPSANADVTDPVTVELSNNPEEVGDEGDCNEETVADGETLYHFVLTNGTATSLLTAVFDQGAKTDDGSQSGEGATDFYVTADSDWTLLTASVLAVPAVNGQTLLVLSHVCESDGDDDDGDDGDDDILEICDGMDNDGDGDIDEGFDDTDGDGIADCVDDIDDTLEVCDGVDNDGDGDIDEGFDTNDDDGDGIPNCNDTIDDTLEICDGMDNDGDGDIDEGFDDTDGDGTADCVDSSVEVPCVGSVTVIVVDADTGEELENVTVTIGDDSGIAPFDVGDLSCTTITTSVDTDTLPTGYELEGDDTRGVTLTADDPDATVVYPASGSDVLSGVEERPAPDTDEEQPAPDVADDTDDASAPDPAPDEDEAEVESLALTGMDSLALALLALALVAAGVGADRLTRRREEA